MSAKAAVARWCVSRVVDQTWRITVCAEVTSAVLAIAGMQKNTCRERITEVLGSLEGVRSVDVSLIRAEAVVVYGQPCDISQILESLQAAGYEAEVI